MNNFRQEIQSLPLKLIYNILPQSLLHRGMLTHTVLTCKCLADDQVKFRAQQIMNTMRNWYWVFADCCSRSVPINTRVTIYFIRIYSLCPSMLLAILSIYSVVSSMPPMKYAVFNYMWQQTNNDPCVATAKIHTDHGSRFRMRIVLCGGAAKLLLFVSLKNEFFFRSNLHRGKKSIPCLAFICVNFLSDEHCVLFDQTICLAHDPVRQWLWRERINPVE